MQDVSKAWEVATQGQIYVADFEEIKQWIVEGAILPSDKVRRGNLRWLPADKVPELYALFNLEDFNIAFSSGAKSSKSESPDFQTQCAIEDLAEENVSGSMIEDVCHLHRDLDAVFVCDICQKSFCKACPTSYGTVKICPLCGSLCRSVNEPAKNLKSVGAINKPYLNTDKNTGKSGKQNHRKFQRSDFAKALVYSLRYLMSLIWVVKLYIFSNLNKMRWLKWK